MCQNTTMRICMDSKILRFMFKNTLHSCHNFPDGAGQATRGARICESSILVIAVTADALALNGTRASASQHSADYKYISSKFFLCPSMILCNLLGADDLISNGPQDLLKSTHPCSVNFHGSILPSQLSLAPVACSVDIRFPWQSLFCAMCKSGFHSNHPDCLNMYLLWQHAADDLAMQRSRASVPMVLIYFFQNIPASPPEGLSIPLHHLCFFPCTCR